MKPAALISVFLLSVQFVWSQEIHPDSTEHKREFKVLPTAYYTPETRIAFEAFAYYKFYASGADRPSNIRLFAAYTQNNQVVVDLPWQVFGKNEDIRMMGKADYRLFPEYYYGLGNYTQENTRSLYTFRSAGIRNTLQKQWRSNVFAGFTAEARFLDATLPGVEFDAREMYDVRGEGGCRFAGIGPTITYDARDFMLCPSQGAFAEFTATFNLGEDAGGELRYAKMTLDLRKYFSLDSSTVLAFQGYAATVAGEAPYRELPAIGGPLMHRGYYFGRLRDRHAVLTQAEVRRHLFWRFGMAVFGSVGRVYFDLDQPILRDYRPAGGAGLRFRIGKHDNTNIRFDVAITPDSHGFYVYFAEAF